MAGIMVAGLALNVALNLALIPPHGPKGAAASLIASEAFVLMGQAALIHRHVFEVPFAQLLVKPLAAGLVTVPVVLLLSPYSGLLAGVAGGVVFAGVLLLSRYISRTEWEPLTKPLAALFARAW